MPLSTSLPTVSLAAVLAVLAVAPPVAADTTAAQTAAPAGPAVETPLVSPNPGVVSLALTGVDPALRAFYSARLDAPVWHSGETWVTEAAPLLTVLAGAADHGLDPADYLPLPPAAVLAAAPSDHFDVALTDALLRYVADVTGGRIPPESRPGHRYPHGVPQREAAAAGLLAQALAAPDPAAALAALQPADPSYGRLKALLADLRQQKAATGGWPAVPAGPSVREGDGDPRLALMQASLVLHGDLDPAQAQRSPTVHEGPLVAALKRFQARHGITVDGILGADTVKTLNTSLDERITQVVANLERLRWDPPLPRSGKVIEVNVPEYRLTAYQDGAPALDMKVVVGTEENRTPLFTDYMDDVVLNPTWTVPYSIAREEILPKLRADPAYTIGQNMDIFAGWSHSAPVVDPWSVDWSAVNGRNMPYRFVERAGPGNALGRVRFSLNNDFAIYLHDTPAKSKFDRPHRAYSHGCVRVGDYDALLGFVAGDQADRLRGLLDTGRTMTMKLPRNVDVRIVYHSAWVDELGTPHFRRDVYGFDPEVAQRLREGGRGLIALKRQDVGLK